MLYIPTLNPIIFAPALERDPQTGIPFGGRAQVFPSAAEVQLQLYTDTNYYPAVYIDYDDGTSAMAAVTVEHQTTAESVLDGVIYNYIGLRLIMPRDRAFRIRIEMGTAVAVSGCICARNDVSAFRKLVFTSDEYMEGDTLMHDMPYRFTPTVWVEGGFFTSGFTPDSDSEDFLDQNRVSRYTSAFPYISREFVLGGVQGIDNRLAAFLNAAFCLPSIDIDGRSYARFAGAKLKSLGDKQIPCRAWSIALQNADGDNAVAFATSDVSGALVDSQERYIVDATGNYIKANI